MVLSNLDVLATAPGGVARLRELILTLAVQGKLVPQDPGDEPASALLKKIRAEKDRLIAEGKIKRDKPLAEIAEEEKPFELPTGWEWVRLGDVQLFTNGYAFKSAQFADAGVGVVRISNVQSGAITENGMVYLPTHLAGEIDKQFFIEPGDLVITMTGDVKLGFNRTTNRFLLNQRVGKIEPLLVKVDYLVFCLTLVADQKIADASGSVIPNVSTGEINETPFALPPLAEQSRIVTRVEELMRLCDALEAKARLEATQHAQLVSTLLGTLTASTTPEELADNWHRVATHFDLLLDRPEAVDVLEQTILQLAVRGLLVPQDPQDEPASELLKKIRAEKDRLILDGKIKRDKPLPPIAEDEQPYVLPNGWVWVRLNDLIRIGSGDGLTAAQMAPAGTIPVFGGNGVNGHHDKANVDEPTLVIGRVGYYCGSVHITPAKAWVTDNAFITRYPKVCLDMEWLYWLLVGTNLKENDSATAQPVISGRKLYPIVVALPPLAEQSRIVARVASLRALCADLRQRLAAAQATQFQLAEALVGQVPK